MKSILIALSAVVMSAFPALAAPMCLPLEQIEAVTKEKGYVIAMEMLGAGGELYRIIVDPKTGMWGAVAIPPKDGKACFVAEGPKYKLVGFGV